MKAMAFEKSDRGFTVRCWYGEFPGDNARMEITKGPETIRHFEYPAYRIWNIAAHFSEIVDALQDAP